MRDMAGRSVELEKEVEVKYLEKTEHDDSTREELEFAKAQVENSSYILRGMERRWG